MRQFKVIVSQVREYTFVVQADNSALAEDIACANIDPMWESLCYRPEIAEVQELGKEIEG